MRSLQRAVAAVLALGGVLFAADAAVAREMTPPVLTPIVSHAAATAESATGSCDRVWGNRRWHRGYYGYHRPLYRPYRYGYRRPWGWHHGYGWHHRWHRGPWGHRHGWRRW